MRDSFELTGGEIEGLDYVMSSMEGESIIKKSLVWIRPQHADLRLVELLE